MPFPWKLGQFPRAIPAPRCAQVQCWVFLLSCMEEECVFLWVMRMHCFVQNRLLGVLECSGKCVINEEVVTCPAYCSLFCWSQGKLSEPEGSMWCSKHDLLPCDGSRQQLCLPAAPCACCRADWAVPVLSLIHGDFTLLTTRVEENKFCVFKSLLTWLEENSDHWHHGWWKIPLWNPVFQTTHGKQKKISLCISLISPVVFPHLVAV